MLMSIRRLGRSNCSRWESTRRDMQVGELYAQLGRLVRNTV